jgi:hypothetical protein
MIVFKFGSFGKYLIGEIESVDTPGCLNMEDRLRRKDFTGDSFGCMDQSLIFGIGKLQEYRIAPLM